MAQTINIRKYISRLLIVVFAVSCSFGYTCSAQQKDTVTLYGGQILVGDIKSASLGELIIDDIDLKILQLKQYKIRTIKTNRSYKIETNDKEIYFGILGPSSKPGYVILTLDNGEVLELQIMDLSHITVLRESFFKQVDGTLSAGFSYSKSSDIGQVNFSTNSIYASKAFQYYLSADLIGSIDSSKYSRDREDAGFFVSYNFYKTTWIASTGISYQRNLELSLARRFQQFIGGGNKLFLERYWQLLALTGMTINEEKSTAGATSGPLFELPIILRFDFFRYSRPNVQITATQNVFFSLSQKGRIRYDGSVSFSWEVVHHFYLTLNPYATYDNKPAEGSSNFDFGTSISVSFKY
jgi:uncharacterized protein DUF481